MIKKFSLSLAKIHIIHIWEVKLRFYRNIAKFDTKSV